MRYICIDYGTKRVGVAISDEGGTMAFPLDVLKNDDSLIQRIRKIIDESGAKHIVLGEGRTLTGMDNPLREDVEAFAQTLGEVLGLPVSMQDENFSSVEAARFAPVHKNKRDDAAAAVILQRFLDARQASK